MPRDVGVTVGRHDDHPHPARVERGANGGTDIAGAADPARIEPVHPRDCDRVDRLGRAEQLVELGHRTGRQEVEDATAAVVEHHEGRPGAAGRRRGRAEEPVGVVEPGEVAEETDGRRVAPDRDPERRRHEPVDAVRAAVGVHAHARARRGEPLDLAHRHARRDEQRAAVGNRRVDVARDARVERSVVAIEEGVDGRTGGVLGRAPTREPRRLATGVSDDVDEIGEQRFGIDGQPLARGAVRIEPAPVGIDDDLLDRSGRAMPSRPCS